MNDSVYAAIRAVHFFASMLMLGVWLFDRLVAITVAPCAAWRKTAIWLMVIGLSLAAASGIGWLGCLSVTINDDMPPRAALAWTMLKLILLQTQFGAVWRLRAAMWLGSAVLLIAVLLTGFGKSTLSWLAILCNGGFVASLAWAGHGQTGQQPTIHLFADVVHLLASAAWPLGLLPFAILLLHMRRRGDTVAYSTLARRFSLLAFRTVVLLLVSGFVNSWFLVGSFDKLLHTPYGHTLMWKIVAFIFMVMLGAINLVWLKPRITANCAAARWLQWNVAMELLLAMAVLALVGFLGQMPPAIELSP